MNNPTSQIKALAHNLFKAQPGTTRRNVMHPKRDWTIGILIGLLLLVFLGGWSTYMYFEHRNGGNISAVKVEIALPAYNAALVEQAQEFIAARSITFVALSQVVETNNEVVESLTDQVVLSADGLDDLPATVPEAIDVEESVELSF